VLLLKLYPYFTAALMVLALSSPVLQVRRSLPEAGSCVEHAGTLLRNITDALTQTKLFSGLDCTKQNMELNLETSTPSVCSPQESCLTNIGKDLTHYYKVLSAQPDPDRVLGSSVLHSLRQLMENCFMESLPTNLVAAADRQSTFGERLSLCKVLRGFQVRTITINRAISYMNSSEHFQ
uniref:Interleukin-12 subunit alpha n=1 Tax=Kryptolebias marmoratus TaxID=37003 RepID=A0A3Q3FMM6_KRYMA